ncbi:MAG: hypothetical protein RI883_2233 [Bacteroidota bacterium]|jgi:hypothetical protein
MKKISLQSILVCCISFSSYGQGPQTPPCGIVKVTTNEVIAGIQFPKGQYQINVIGMSCDEVMGDTGLFSQFLQLKDNDELPEPWKYLKRAVGAPKFVKGPGVGFRVERIAD